MSILKNKKNHCSTEHSPIKHMLHMVVCCGLPIIIILALPFIARLSPAAAGVLGVITPFICPVLMGGMMFMMFRNNKHSCCDDTKADSNQELTNNN